MHQHDQPQVDARLLDAPHELPSLTLHLPLEGDPVSELRGADDPATHQRLLDWLTTPRVLAAILVHLGAVQPRRGDDTGDRP